VPRAGRLLEELVQGLERVLTDSPVEIRSPDYIIGKNSRKRREVDVSLRSKVGSVSILVIIECRDRKIIQDVTWIEQLASKRKDVGADKAIAVSVAGFSEGARNLARSEQIDLRSFEELDDAVVFDWMEVRTIEYRTRRAEVIGASITIADETTGITPAEVFSAAERIRREGIRQDDKIFVRTADKTMASIDDIWITTPGLGIAFDGAFPELRPGEKQRSILVINFASPQFSVGTAAGLHNMTSITIDGHFSYDEELVPVSRRYEYLADSGTITENAEATIERDGRHIILGVHAAPDRSMFAASIRPTGDTPTIGGVDITFDILEGDDNGD
jgi:hypothetical protein